MDGTWQYQIRITLAEPWAAVARSTPDDPGLAALNAILHRHDAELKCQFDAFAGYVAEAEEQGIEAYPLYAWTKATIDNPAKKAKYLLSFTLYYR